MSEIDVIRQIAQQSLSVPTLAGIQDNWLWDRTLRILRNEIGRASCRERV